MDTTHTITEMMSLSYHMLKDEWTMHGPTANFSAEIMEVLRDKSQLTVQDGLTVASITLGLTIARYLLTTFIFQVQSRIFSLTLFVISL